MDMKEFRKRAYGTIGYLATWHGGHSYGQSYDYRDNAEFFHTLEFARDEFSARFRGSWGGFTYLEFNDFGEITGVKMSESFQTPAVDETAYMDLRVIWIDLDGDIQYGEEIVKRYSFGPRGGVVESD